MRRVDYADHLDTSDALLSPDIALETVVDDWVENYQSSANDEPSERTAVHELVLCLIRCCGINADVDEDEAMDVDGVTDVIERIQDESIRVSRGDQTHPFPSPFTGGRVHELR